MLLQQSQPVSGVVLLHRHDGEGVTKLVRAHVMYLTSLGIHQFPESCPVCAVPDDLPGPVAVDTKKELAPLARDRPAFSDIFLDLLQSIFIYR